MHILQVGKTDRSISLRLPHRHLCSLCKRSLYSCGYQPWITRPIHLIQRGLLQLFHPKTLSSCAKFVLPWNNVTNTDVADLSFTVRESSWRLLLLAVCELRYTLTDALTDSTAHSGCNFLSWVMCVYLRLSLRFSVWWTRSNFNEWQSQAKVRWVSPVPSKWLTWDTS